MRYSQKRKILASTIRRDMPFYMAAAVVLVVGVIIGSIAVKVLEYEQKKSLVVYMNRFFQLVNKEEVKNSSLFFHSVKTNFQTVFFIWILSMTVIGIPFTLFMVGFKGFVTGFTIAFLVEGFGLKGLLFSIAAILPQNLLVIACMFVLTAASLKYSLGLLKKNFLHVGKNLSVAHLNVGSYTGICAIVFAAMTVASVFEAFLSSAIIRLAAGFIIIK